MVSDAALPRTGTSTDAFETRLGEVLTRMRERAYAFPAPYSQLWETVERMATGGKKIRPRLLLGAYEALGGIDERSAIDAACAMELLHLALVIHDDVIDKDVTRRGEMNITGSFASEAMVRGAGRSEATAWGEASSLLAGDLVLTLSHSLLARLEVPEDRRQAVLDVFDDTVFESAAGEHHDVWLSMRLEQSSPEDVLAMVDQKTAAYSFRAPLVTAAVLAGATTALITELESIARQIGVVYQLRDDVLGLFGDEHQTGKSTLSDLREGKETLLVTYARSDVAWTGVEHLFGDPSLTAADGARLRRVIEESGALVFVESVIAERCTAIDEAIRAASLPPSLHTQLTELTVTCRTRVS